MIKLAILFLLSDVWYILKIVSAMSLTQPTTVVARALVYMTQTKELRFNRRPKVHEVMIERMNPCIYITQEEHK